MNTQIINLTPPIDGVQYGYSNEPLKGGDWACRNIEPFILHIKEGWNNSLDLQYRKIVCSTNPKDTRFPFLQLPSKEQEVKKLAKEATKNEPIQVMPHLQHYFIIGFNANKGVYTQEQMEKAFIAGRNSIFSSKSPTGIIEQQEYIQSLQPTAKAVRVEMVDNGYEVDMEGRGGMELGETCWLSKIEIKVETSSEFEQGIVRAIEVIY